MIRKALLLTILLLGVLYGQDEIDSTRLMCNGRMWRKMSVDHKLAYVMGIKDAWVESALASGDVTKFVENRWADRFTVKDYMKELDLIYRDGENIRLPIPAAIWYCTAKLKGKSTKAELERALIYLREFWTSPLS